MCIRETLNDERIESITGHAEHESKKANKEGDSDGEQQGKLKTKQKSSKVMG